MGGRGVGACEGRARGRGMRGERGGEENVRRGRRRMRLGEGRVEEGGGEEGRRGERGKSVQCERRVETLAPAPKYRQVGGKIGGGWGAKKQAGEEQKCRWVSGGGEMQTSGGQNFRQVRGKKWRWMGRKNTIR